MKTSRILCFYFGGVEFNKRLYARSCGDFILVPPDTEIFRTVDFGEIFWPVSGQCSFRMEGREWTVRPGYLWYYPPGAHHEYNPLNPFHYCWLAVGGTGAGPFFDLMGIEPGINRAGLCPQRLFLQLGNEINSRTPQGRYASLNTTFRIVSQVNFLSRTAKDKEGSLMEKAKALIENTSDDPGLNVSRLAQNFHLHRGSFSRAFHKAFDTTAQDYITLVRLRNAMTMLAESSFSIKEIATACGFSAANYP